ncbi:MAG: transporter, family, tartrate transporter [Bradyrhizobium sp.]|jgi:ACS family tartrate transporter-like MFS transporter|nr:transporter, family, tartrate transporter [Bradyrhizobium sp.]
MALLQQSVPADSGVAAPSGSDAVLQSAIRKAALRFVPLLTISYLFNYLDRTSIGFAALTMNQQLGLSAGQFGLAAGIFFLGYSLFEIPSNLLLYRFGARRWLARIMITWGLVSAATALVVGPNSFYAARLLLGIAEAGFFPGVTFFLAAWFPAQYRTRMLAWFLVGIPASSLVGAPVCGMLLQMNGIWGLAGWQWLFIVVSLPCIPLGLLTLRLLADRPQTATWLTPNERDVLDNVLASEVRERPHSSLLAALKDTRVLILAGIQFGFTLGSYGIGIWLPLILKEYHLTNFAIGWIAAIPYVFATAGMIFWARHVDQKGRRVVNLAIACFLGGAGLVAPILSGSLAVALLGFSAALVGVTAARAIFWAIPTRFLTGVAAAGGLAFINSIGTVGGFAGPSMMGFLREFSGSYVVGLIAVAAIMIAAAAASMSLKLVMTKE